MTVIDITIPAVIVTVSVAITLVVDLACSILDRIADSIHSRRQAREDEVLIRWARRDSGD